MRKELLNFFSLLRSIFGICPRSGMFFRLSDCKIYLKKRPPTDWLDKLDSKERYLEYLEDRVCSREKELRDNAREKGRELANQIVKKIDTIFRPYNLNPDDSKVIFHPIDYIVFNGMKKPPGTARRPEAKIKNIIFLDRNAKSQEQRTIQKSIEKVIEKGKYEWQTLRVLDSGEIEVES